MLSATRIQVNTGHLMACSQKVKVTGDAITKATLTLTASLSSSSTRSHNLSGIATPKLRNDVGSSVL